MNIALQNILILVFCCATPKTNLNQDHRCIERVLTKQIFNNLKKAPLLLPGKT